MDAVKSIASEFVPGAYVELPYAGRDERVRGLVHETGRLRGMRYIDLYSYATRRVTRYRVDRRGRLHALRQPEAGAPELQYAETHRDSDTNVPTGFISEEPSGIEPSEHETESPKPSRTTILAPLVIAVMSLILVFIVIFPLIQGGAVRLKASTTSYNELLARDLNLSQLLSTVSARVDYRPDVEDYWSAPRAVWERRSGDCEDYALLVSAYLNRHNVSHHVLGMALKPDLQGHVAVVAESERGPVLLDPTRATAPTGLKRYPRGTEIAEIAAEFAALPVDDYGSSPAPGNPRPLRRVE